MWDVSVTSPLTPAEAGMTAATELCKHTASDPKCQKLDEVCVPPGRRDLWELGQREAHTHHFYLSGHSACNPCFSVKKLTLIADLVWC